MLDGGQMFAVVPKVLWEKKIPADSRNRIRLGLTCLADSDRPREHSGGNWDWG